MNIAEPTLSEVVFLEGRGGEELGLGRVAGLEVGGIHRVAPGELTEATVAGHGAVALACSRTKNQRKYYQ